MAQNEITVRKIATNSKGDLVFDRVDNVKFSLWFEGKGYAYSKNRNVLGFYKGAEITKNISRTDIGSLYLLAMNTNEDGALVNKRADCYVPMTDSELAQILDLSRRQTIEVKKRLKENDLIKISKYNNATAIFVNPIYFCGSKYISVHLFVMFGFELSKVLPAWAYHRYINWALDLKLIDQKEADRLRGYKIEKEKK